MEYLNNKEWANELIDNKGGSAAFSRWFGCSPQMVCRYRNEGFNKSALNKLRLAKVIK